MGRDCWKLSHISEPDTDELRISEPDTDELRISEPDTDKLTIQIDELLSY